MKSLEIESLNFPGVFLIDNKMDLDVRGFFSKPYAKEEFTKKKIDFTVAEVFYSVSKENVIRGMHFQLPPFQQAKIVTVISGRVTDVVLDIRKNSPYYKKWISIILEENDGKALYIPIGFAHGFISRDKKSTVLYLADCRYSQESEMGIKYDSFGYDWGTDEPILSNRDLNFIPMSSFQSPFTFVED